MQGNGTWSEPYLIYNTSDFMEFYFKHQPKQWYRLENSIELHSVFWGAIKDSSAFNAYEKTLTANLNLNGYFITGFPDHNFHFNMNSEDGLWKKLTGVTIVNGGFVGLRNHYGGTILAQNIVDCYLDNLFLEFNNYNSREDRSNSTVFCFRYVANSVITNLQIQNTGLADKIICNSTQLADRILNTVIHNVCFLGIHKSKNSRRLIFYGTNFNNPQQNATHVQNIYTIEGTPETSKYDLNTSLINQKVVSYEQLSSETFNKLPTYNIAPNTPVWIVETGKIPQLGMLDYETFFIGLDTGWWVYDPIQKECTKVANIGEENLPNSGGIPKGWISLLTALDWDVIKKNGALQSIARVCRNPANKRIGVKETTIQATKQDNVFTVNLDWNTIGDYLFSIGVNHA